MVSSYFRVTLYNEVTLLCQVRLSVLAGRALSLYNVWGYELFLSWYPFSCSSCNIVFCSGITTHSYHSPGPESIFALRLPLRFSLWRIVFPDDAGIGLTPHNAANDDSFLNRLALSSAVTKSVAAHLCRPQILTQGFELCLTLVFSKHYQELSLGRWANNTSEIISGSLLLEHRSKHATAHTLGFGW